MSISKQKTPNIHPVHVSYHLKSVLLEFSLRCLLENPKQQNIIQYAEKYFKDLLNSKAIAESILSESAESIADIESRRVTVSGDDYNPSDVCFDEYEKIPKSEEQRTCILENMKKLFLFKTMDEEDVGILIDYMFPKFFEPEEITYEIDGINSYFYVKEKGEFRILVIQIDPLGQKPKKSCEDSGFFGDLALLYGLPRTISIKAITEGCIWVLDGDIFRKVLRKAAYRRIVLYNELLESVEILDDLKADERITLVDALIPMKFKKGDVILRAGEQSDGMYFLLSGSVKCTVYDEEIKKDMEVSLLHDGKYFGESTLITDEPRIATVTASEDIKVAFLEKEKFERLLGPCLEIMKRDAKSFKDEIERILNHTCYEKVEKNDEKNCCERE